MHVRRHGEQVVITCAVPDGAAEVARHQVTTPGSPRVDDGHYPNRGRAYGTGCVHEMAARAARRAAPGAETPHPRGSPVPGHRRRRRAVARRSGGIRRRLGAGQDGTGGPVRSLARPPERALAAVLRSAQQC